MTNYILCDQCLIGNIFNYSEDYFDNVFTITKVGRHKTKLGINLDAFKNKFGFVLGRHVPSVDLYTNNSELTLLTALSYYFEIAPKIDQIQKVKNTGTFYYAYTYKSKMKLDPKTKYVNSDGVFYDVDLECRVVYVYKRVKINK